MENSLNLEMILSLPKEVKVKENRAAGKPSDVETLLLSPRIKEIKIQKNTGYGSGYLDEAYTAAGGAIVATPEEAYDADIVAKVKEPTPEEYALLKEGSILYTYLHLAMNEETKRLTEVLLDKKITAIAYETVEDKKGELVLLKPMSVIAGQLAIDYGARFLQTYEDGRGMLIGNVEGAEPTRVTIIGCGNVGYAAALKAAGTGSKIAILDTNPERIKQLKKDKNLKGINKLYSNAEIIQSSEEKIREYLQKTDLLIGAPLRKGARAPIVVTKEMIQSMKDGAVIVDVSIDQGGCTELSRPTTHENPVYKEYGKIFCCITNMPGSVARTSTQALTQVTIPYLQKLVNKGFKRAVEEDEGFAKGVNTYKGYITCKAVAESLRMEDRYKDLKELL